MAREVNHFVKLISAFAVIIAFVFFIVSILMGYQWIDAALFLIGIIVANVPEGLLVTFTVILALTAKRMADKNCLVKNLHAVETLGSCSVICSDKTGTLTQNKMTVSHIWYNNEILDTKTDEVKGAVHLKNHCFQTLSTVASLCSRAKFLGNQDDVPIPQRFVCTRGVRPGFQLFKKKVWMFSFQGSEWGCFGIRHSANNGALLGRGREIPERE